MKKFYEAFCKIELTLAIFGLVTSVAVIFLAAMLRTLGSPINWGTDIALLLFTWSTFLGADIAFRANKLVNVDILFNRLFGKPQKVTKLIIYLICLGFLAAMVYLGAIQSVKTWSRSFQGIPALSYTWVTLSVPVSCASMAVTTLIKMHHTLKDQDECTTI
ncbi:TRAP transporter small permease [Marasmitruncus massiliensis]|uniref:TRAP transporter small permease n=1 Tax=Marasmitruncus massiliensis TaxID=1944642 RepID=UPI000C7C59EA|nr:TRAP transporter small permease [Marasmitruncus massiliensis]